MIAYAMLRSRSVRTRDLRTIAWWECELHEANGGVRTPMRPFWSAVEARSWATEAGYEVRHDV